jgi:hypothetical protein
VTFLGCHAPPEAALDRGVVTRPEWRPLDADRATAAQLGREVVETIGYEELIAIARRAGFVTTKKIKRAPRKDGSLLAMDGAAAGDVFVNVFTRYAVAAGIAAAADTPVPGPGDAVAAGIIVVGLFAAGYAKYLAPDRFRPTSTTAAPPAVTTPPAVSAAPTATATKPDKDPKAGGDPTTTGPTPPVPPQSPDCPRNESFTPEHTDNATGCIDKKGNVRCYSRKHRPCAGVHTHGILRYQEIRNGVCKPVEKDAVRCEGPFKVSGPCGSVSTTECRNGGTEISGIFED